AVVARHLLRKRIQNITDKRIEHAHYLDSRLRGIETISVPTREPDIRQVFHIYMVLAENRDELQAHLIKNGVDAKVHYPVPMHLQPAASAYGHRKGDFPRAEYIADHAISLPVHEFITQEQLDTMVRLIEEFYA
ncbi:MAG: DegT/DnrJ/EryC1/StrS family aminotransferase, partial [Leptospiraceae bacterium]|nr:DegT/DnrJ/EryC1/StrS family aminotransferase [Leptospiraceae bacterium]